MAEIFKKQSEITKAPTTGDNKEVKYLQKLNSKQILEMMQTAGKDPKYGEIMATLMYMKKTLDTKDEVNYNTKANLDKLAMLIAYAEFENNSDFVLKSAEEVMKEMGSRFFSDLPYDGIGVQKSPVFKDNVDISKNVKEGVKKPAQLTPQNVVSNIDISAHERQKVVREYFANRGEEVVIIRGKEVKISTLLAGNSLKDGKIGDVTRALEEKMRTEQNEKKLAPKVEQDKNIKPQKAPQSKQSQQNSYPEVKPTIEWTITNEESLNPVTSNIWSHNFTKIDSDYNNIQATHSMPSSQPHWQNLPVSQNPYGIPENGTYVNGFNGNLNNVSVNTNASGQIYYDKKNNSVTIKGSDGSQTCVGDVCVMITK